MGCDAKPKAPGDDDAWLKYIEKWFLGGLAIGGILSYLNIAGAAPVVLSGGAATLAVLAVIIGALAGGTLAAFIGYAVEWSRRLKVQNPSQITIDAFVLCAGKNSGVPPFNDGDWTFNMAIPFTITDPLDAGLTMPVVRTRAAPDSGLATAFESVDGGVDVFHVELPTPAHTKVVIALVALDRSRLVRNCKQVGSAIRLSFIIPANYERHRRTAVFLRHSLTPVVKEKIT